MSAIDHHLIPPSAFYNNVLRTDKLDNKINHSNDKEHHAYSP